MTGHNIVERVIGRFNTIATLHSDMTRSIYRVAVASNAGQALDRATEHPNANSLYDGYIEEATYVGEVDAE